MRPRQIALAVALVGVVAAGCSGAGDGPSSAGAEREGVAGPTTAAPAISPADGDPVPAPLSWSRCAGDFECASLTVPIDYANPASGTIDLAVIRHPADDQRNRVGSLVVNPGGPGGSGIEMVEAGFGEQERLYDRLDVVSWDPRGVGASARLTCGSGADAFLSLDPGPDTPAEQAALDAGAQAVAADCGANAGALLDHMSTGDTVRDLEQLRRAVGDPALTYAGYSYGTAIGLAYAERYPTHIRAMVLDGVVQPEQDLEQALTGQTVAMTQSLDQTFSRCATDRTCRLDDAAGTYDRLAAELEQTPLRAADGSAVGPADLALAAVETTYDPVLDGALWDALALAQAGDGSGIADLADEYRTAVPGYAPYAAVTCVDLPHPVGTDAYRAFADRLTALSPRLGAAVANEMLPCAFWPAPVVGVPHQPDAPGAPPILVVGNTGDAATPFSSAASVAAHLPGSVLLTYDGRGHTSGGRSSCVDVAVRRYLIDLQLPAEGARCAGDS